jgi:hypothetical protein
MTMPTTPDPTDPHLFFRRTIGTLLDHARRDHTLAQARGDEPGRVKARVRLDTLETTRQIFEAGVKLAEKRRAGDAP